MIELTQSPPQSNEWLTVRREGIGASEISVILGNNPWMTPLQLWEIKLGLHEVEVTEPMRIGTLTEPATLTLAAEKNEWNIHSHPDIPSIVGWDKDPLIRASLDGLIIPDRIPVEAKWSRDHSWDRIPTQYEDQCLLQAGIMGAPHTTLVVLHAGGYEQYQVDFDIDWWDWATSEARLWWDKHILGGDQPSPSVGDDMSRMWEPDTGKTVDVPGDEWDAYVTYRAVKEDAGEREATALARIQTIVGDGTTITVRGEKKATWNPRKGSIRFDKKKLEELHPGAVDACTTRGHSTRTWKVK